MPSYSRITKKGQVTIPVRFREKYRLNEGTVVVFKETSAGLIIEPKPDIADSAGALSNYADARELLSELLRTRRESFFVGGSQ
jgi:AbrB family looped-hinge helix DNA binding protein